MKTEYTIVNLTDVINYFVKGYKMPSNTEFVAGAEAVVDTGKGKVALKLTVGDTSQGDVKFSSSAD